MIIALILLNIMLLCIVAALVYKVYHRSNTGAEMMYEPEKNVTTGIRLKDGTELEYIGGEVPEELVRLVDDSYWITERR